MIANQSKKEMEREKSMKKFGRNLLWMATAGVLALGMVACGGKSTTGSSSGSKEEGSTQAGSEQDGTEKAGEKAEAKVKGSNGSFNVGFDQEFPPMGFVGEDGSYTGYDLELAEEVAKRLDLTFVPKPINWDAKDLELNSGNIDCIWNGFGMEGREDSYTFVGPYLANKQVFVVREDSDISSLSDLKGKAVEVQKDSTGLTALNREENKSLKDSFGSLTEVGDYQNAMMDLESGACDAICMDSVVAEYQIKTFKKKAKVLSESLTEEQYGIGFKKGNTELADKVKKTLLEMKEEGVIDKINEKWFGTTEGFILQ